MKKLLLTVLFFMFVAVYTFSDSVTSQVSEDEFSGNKSIIITINDSDSSFQLYYVQNMNSEKQTSTIILADKNDMFGPEGFANKIQYFFDNDRNNTIEIYGINYDYNMIIIKNTEKDTMLSGLLKHDKLVMKVFDQDLFGSRVYVLGIEKFRKEYKKYF